MAENWRNHELERVTHRKCVCGLKITSGYLAGEKLIVMHESPGCEAYRNFGKGEDFLKHVDQVMGRLQPRTQEERGMALLELIKEFGPRFIPLLPENRVTFPIDSTKIRGDQLHALMSSVGGNYGAMTEFVRVEADYLVSFGWLNMMLDCIRQQLANQSNTGNA